jgi:hypothetical protein
LEADEIRTGTGWSDVPDGRRSRLVSHQREDIYVSVEDGDDENGGRSQDDAYETINRALAEVPKFCYHSIFVHVDYGDYRDQDGPRIFHVHQTARSTHGNKDPVGPWLGGGLKLWGHTPNNDYYDDSRSVEDVVFAYGLDSGCIGSEELVVRGITVDGRWQSYDSSIRFRDCLFRGGAGPEGKKQLIGGHRTRAQYWACRFEDADLIGSIGGLCFVGFNGQCEIENVTQPFNLWGGSIVYLHEVNHDLLEKPPKRSTIDGGGLILNHPRGINQLDGGTSESRGDHTFRESILLDDPGDDGDPIRLENDGGSLLAVVDGEEIELA